MNTFIQTILPFAKEVKAQYKVPVSVCIAQAALETGWGRFVVGNNYFGIKATPFDGGTSVEVPTMECINGKWVQIVATFCQYPTMEASVLGYGKLLRESSIYVPCFLSTNPQDFCVQLQMCGYATDPNYAEKLIAIINGSNLIQYDVEVTASPPA
jgi:flagellum-specific peptidoglycan hydrolase FlgJ